MLKDVLVNLSFIISQFYYFIYYYNYFKIGEGVDATEILSDEDIVIHRDQSTKNKYGSIIFFI